MKNPDLENNFNTRLIGPYNNFTKKITSFIKLIICLLVLVPLSQNLHAATQLDSKGTDFWLMFDGNYTGGSQLTLFIAGDTATTGTISIPGLSFTSPFTVTPGSVTSVVLPGNAQAESSDTIESLGIHVSSAAEVTVYGLNRLQYTTDAVSYT